MLHYLIAHLAVAHPPELSARQLKYVCRLIHTWWWWWTHIAHERQWNISKKGLIALSVCFILISRVGDRSLRLSVNEWAEFLLSEQWSSEWEPEHGENQLQIPCFEIQLFLSCTIFSLQSLRVHSPSAFSLLLFFPFHFYMCTSLVLLHVHVLNMPTHESQLRKFEGKPTTKTEIKLQSENFFSVK